VAGASLGWPGEGSRSAFAGQIVAVNVSDGRLTATAIIAGTGLLLTVLWSHLSSRRTTDAYRRYYARKVVRYVIAIAALIALGIVWRPFAGQLGLLIGLVGAGLALAMQEMIGAVAGWFNILSGGIFRVGDRVQVGGVDGDVIDITPLRTKLLEIGSDVAGDTWVRGRQYTGRIVSVSNKATFTRPVYNYSGIFEFIWEEITVPISYRDDWREAEKILSEEIDAFSTEEGAREAIREMNRRYPTPSQELEPRVYIRATDNYLELAGRFIVPVRTSRTVKDAVTRRVLERLAAAGIVVASTTQDLTVRRPGEE
jgi:small-conductance mechanosensitive channel